VICRRTRPPRDVLRLCSDKRHALAAGTRHPDLWRDGTADAFLLRLVGLFRAEGNAKRHHRQTQCGGRGSIGRPGALAVTTATRSEALPDVPAVGEFVPGYEASTWYGVGAPKNTPAEIVEKLNKEINAALADPKLKARLADLGAEPMSMTPAEFGKLIADETEKWAKVVKFSGAKPD
jgi:hypothetical protein